MQLNYDEIRRIYRLEKNSTSLVEVDEDFFDGLNRFVVDEKKEYLRSLKTFSTAKMRNFTNLKKMVEEIISLREKKLLNKALVACRTGESAEQKISSQEKKTFKDMLAVLEKHHRFLDEIFETEQEDDSEKREPTSEVKILKDIPSFVGTDMKEYGPYSEGQTVSLPSRIVKLLSARKLVEAD